jgi:hypothetical protein
MTGKSEPKGFIPAEMPTNIPFQAKEIALSGFTLVIFEKFTIISLRK